MYALTDWQTYRYRRIIRLIWFYLLFVRKASTRFRVYSYLRSLYLFTALILTSTTLSRRIMRAKETNKWYFYVEKKVYNKQKFVQRTVLYVSVFLRIATYVWTFSFAISLVYLRTRFYWVCKQEYSAKFSEN